MPCARQVGFWPLSWPRVPVQESQTLPQGPGEG